MSTRVISWRNEQGYIEIEESCNSSRIMDFLLRRTPRKIKTTYVGYSTVWYEKTKGDVKRCSVHMDKWLTGRVMYHRCSDNT